jgi:hypothetical protein
MLHVKTTFALLPSARQPPCMHCLPTLSAFFDMSDPTIGLAVVDSVILDVNSNNECEIHHGLHADVNVSMRMHETCRRNSWQGQKHQNHPLKGSSEGTFRKHLLKDFCFFTKTRCSSPELKQILAFLFLFCFSFSKVLFSFRTPFSKSVFFL